MLDQSKAHLLDSEVRITNLIGLTPNQHVSFKAACLALLSLHLCCSVCQNDCQDPGFPSRPLPCNDISDVILVVFERF